MVDYDLHHPDCDMSNTSGQPRVWSLWIYDRHCTLIYHADWSVFHNRTTANAAGQASSSSGDGIASGTARGSGRSNGLPLAEQAKLVYGLVFSLRNITRKLSPQQSSGPSSGPSGGPSTGGVQETMHSFSTATYTLAHLQTPTQYTFVMLTDPVPPPTRRAPTTTGGTGSATFSGGGGIPATGGMTTTGVLTQISRGPWVEFVARNAGCLSLMRQDDSDEDGDGDGDEQGFLKTTEQQTDPAKVKAREERKEEQRRARQKEVQRQRLTGLGKSVDSEAFRAAVERVLAQNKLNAPRM